MALRGMQFASVEGLRELKKLINPPDELVAKPWRNAMETLAHEGMISGRINAPYRTGQLREKISGAVHRKPFPMWAAIRSRGVSKAKKTSISRSRRQYPHGYPYPRLLNYSPKHGHAGWFDRAVIQPTMAKADSVLSKAGAEIARNWEMK